ncbi:DUF4231 domain-containing protein [Nostoc sp. FACHB-973]|nr:DUF4231 domain-containing protein [Nostoc sp. FACHB-973]
MSITSKVENTGDLITSISTVKDVAINRIKEYKEQKKINKRFYYTSQGAIIVLTGITPLILIMSSNPVYPALSSALASITVALASAFKFRDKYELHKSALENIEVELTNLNLGTGRYYYDEDPNNKAAQDKKKNNDFMFCIDAVHQKRMNSWVGLMSSSSSADSQNQNQHEETPPKKIDN